MDNFVLSKDVVKRLAEKFFQIPFHEPPEKYRKWHVTICEKLKAIKYFNPEVPAEYVVIVHRYKTGAVHCLYHSPSGFSSIDWFAEFVPLICLETQWRKLHEEASSDKLPYDLRTLPYRTFFTVHINEAINPKYPNLDPIAIRSIHGLFDIYLPFIDGICLKCFQTTFPEKGQGIRYLYQPTKYDYFDIKLSPPKPDGYAPQHEIYITNTLQVKGQKIYIAWKPWKDEEPLFRKECKHPSTHMPFRPHQQTKINELLAKEAMKENIKKFIGTTKEISLPLCRCK